MNRYVVKCMYVCMYYAPSKLSFLNQIVDFIIVLGIDPPPPFHSFFSCIHITAIYYSHVSKYFSRKSHYNRKIIQIVKYPQLDKNRKNAIILDGTKILLIDC